MGENRRPRASRCKSPGSGRGCRRFPRPTSGPSTSACWPTGRRSARPARSWPKPAPGSPTRFPAIPTTRQRRQQPSRRSAASRRSSRSVSRRPPQTHSPRSASPAAASSSNNCGQERREVSAAPFQRQPPDGPAATVGGRAHIGHPSPVAGRLGPGHSGRASRIHVDLLPRGIIMVRKIAIASAFAGSALCASLAFAAGPPKLPNFGHYVGYGTITVATDCPASLTVGQSFQNQLELNTPAERLVVLIRQVVPGSSPDYVPAIVKTRLEKTGGTHLSPSGTAVISDEVGGS